MIRAIVIIFFLVLSFQPQVLCFEPRIQFFDANNNGAIEEEESRAFEEARLKIFDRNHNKSLDRQEMDLFLLINSKLSAGGENLTELNEEQKNVYKEWREVLLSARMGNSAGQAAPGTVNEPNIAKCYPEKICDEPFNTESGRAMGYAGPVPGQPVDLGKEVIVFYAAGFNASIDGMIKEFNNSHNNPKIIGESSSTLMAIRKITELNKRADIVMVADALVIKDMLIPKYADWYISFYRDRVVLAYTDKSKYTNEINSKNWYKILARKDVRFGYANPNLAPIGYRTLMSWQLADLYYKDKINNKSIHDALKELCPRENMMSDVAEMLPLLESMSLDYAFIYESTAKQHNLKYVQLPKEIDLGSPELADLYKQAKVEITSGKTGKKENIAGSPIMFALTVLKDAPNYAGAVEFVRMFLGPDGQKIMASNDQAMAMPYAGFNLDTVPPKLREYMSAGVSEIGN